MKATGFGTFARPMAAALLLGQLGCDACDPWPEPPPPSVRSIAAFPGGLDIQIDNPANERKVLLVGQAYDRYGRVVAREPLQFSTTGGATGVALAPVSAPHDTTALTILATTDPAPADFSFSVRLAHASAIVPIEIPVHVSYKNNGMSGATIQAAIGNWPSVGLASGQTTAGWQRNLLNAFVQRTGFADFITSGAIPPVGDEASGTIMSQSYALVRAVSPWSAMPGDVTVPAGTPASMMKLTPVFAGSNFAASAQLLADLQGAADIIEHTLVGIQITVGPLAQTASAISWTDNCTVLGSQVFALPAAQQPAPSSLAVYMLKRTGLSGGDRALRCGPETMGVVGSGREEANAIFLPEGPVSSATIAHEIGHTLSLEHVTSSSGFFDSDLMAETDDAIAILRDRISVGQAFRAALDPKSWIVIAGAARSASIDCAAFPMKCPLLNADASKRSPP